MLSGLVTEYLLLSSRHNMHSLHYHCCSIRQVSNSKLILLQINDDYKTVNKNVGVHINTYQINHNLHIVPNKIIFFTVLCLLHQHCHLVAHLGLIRPAKSHFQSSVGSDLIYVTTRYI